jgi:hypothetical protein
MREALVEKQPDVLVRKTVDGALPLAPERDQVAVAQHPQLVAGGRLRYARDDCKVADTQLLSRERLQDTQTSRIRQSREHIHRSLLETVFCEQRRHTGDGRFVDHGNQTCSSVARITASDFT